MQSHHIFIHVGTSGPKILAISCKGNLPGSKCKRSDPPFEWVCLNYTLKIPMQPGCWKMLASKERRETSGNSRIGECPWFFCNTPAADALFFGHSVGPSRVSKWHSRSRYFPRRMSRCAPTSRWDVLWPCHDVVLHMCFTHDIRTAMTSSWNWDVCLINDVSWRFPFFFTERKHAKNQRHIASKWLAITVHSCTARGKIWVHFVAPSLNLCICNRIAMTCDDLLYRSACFFACQNNLPSKHSICGYNIKGAPSCHFHVNLTRASESILMQASSSLGNPLQGQKIVRFLESGINFHRCTNLLYCKQ